MISANNTLAFVDLFAGIGGFRLALELLGMRCVFSSEIDPHCQKMYLENFGELPAGDITKCDFKTIPRHQILTAGFPCQPFSMSGRRRGFDDTRGTLFFSILEVLKSKEPSVVLLENVKGLLYHDGGRTFSVILDCLNDLGYEVSFCILNASDFGVAQNRERLIIVGSKEKKFDFTKLKKVPSVSLKEALMDFSLSIPASNSPLATRCLRPSEYTLLPRNLWKRQMSGLIFCGYRNGKLRGKGVRENTQHLSRVHKQPNRIYFWEGIHPTLSSQETSGRYWIYDGNVVRKLTLEECFLLMGFPVSHKKNVPQSQLYRQIGNSVCVPMISEIGKELIAQLF